MKTIKKTVCLSIPCYNEEKNVEPLVNDLIEMFDVTLKSKYNLIIQFIDNNSTDNTEGIIKKMCQKHKEVRAIFNAKNFPMTSGYYGFLQTEGDCTILLPCDYQVPLSNIPIMLERWESGYSIVLLIKNKSEEKGLLRLMRKLFYQLSDKLTETKIYKGYSGNGLYEKKFVNICKDTHDNVPNLLQMVSVYGYNISIIDYKEVKRKNGKSKNSISTLINIAIERFISMSNYGPRIATVFGFLMALLSFIAGFVYLILKLLFWYQYPAGTAPLLFGVFFLGSVQIFMIGLVGLYVIKVNSHVMKRPLVVEKERINFSKKEKEKI